MSIRPTNVATIHQSWYHLYNVKENKFHKKTNMNSEVSPAQTPNPIYASFF